MEFILAMAPQGGDGSSLTSTLIMFGAIFAIFYFMIIRPQQKRQKERDSMLSDLKKGDKVMTSGGMHGTIDTLDEKTVVLNVVPGNIKIKFERSAIASPVKAKEKE